MGKQVWRSLGRVFCADGGSGYLASHATYPTPIPLAGDRIRVYFSPRNEANRSSIFFLDLALDTEKYEVLSLSDSPLLTPGRRGAFDDSGVTVSSVAKDGNRLLVYYLGWSVSTTVPFRTFIGLAIGPSDGGALVRYSEAPVVERSAVDPFTIGYPWVLREGDSWRMWYGSHLEWGPQGVEMRHVIKDAQSKDGIAWRRDGHIAVPLQGAAEYAVSRPCVVHDLDRYRMWYSRRDPAYRLGYAESSDAITWTRKDHELSFAEAPGDWENEDRTYPAVFDHKGRRYMLYNGNGHGRTGFGLAILES